MSSVLSPAELAVTADHLMAAKMFSLASCVMLFYDIALTFGDEIEKIWKRKFTAVTVLWFMNRYLSPLGYIVIIVSFHDPWRKSTCNRYVLYPEALKLFTALAIGLIFILRLYAIYSRSRAIAIAVSVLLAAELGVKIWAFTDGTSLDLPPGLVGCILVGRSATGTRFVYTWVAELAFDFTVFIATLCRTIVLYRQTTQKNTKSLIEVIMRDGIVYFGVICAANIITVLMFILAPADIKAVNASFSTLITSLMVSRLILNLRGAVEEKDVFQYNHQDRPGGARATALTDHIPLDALKDATTTTKKFSVSTILSNSGHWTPPVDWRIVSEDQNTTPTTDC